MKIMLNGETKEVDSDMTITTMIKRFGYDENVGAVAVNMVFVPSDRYGETVLQEGDKVEILGPVCGG